MGETCGCFSFGDRVQRELNFVLCGWAVTSVAKNTSADVRSRGEAGGGSLPVGMLTDHRER